LTEFTSETYNLLEAISRELFPVFPLHQFELSQRETIFRDDEDRIKFLSTLGKCMPTA